MTRLPLAIALAMPALLPLSAAENLKPAPQEFHQEITRQWPSQAPSRAVKAPWLDAPLQLVDVAHDGTVRVTDGAVWYSFRDEQFQRESSPEGEALGAGHFFLGNVVRALPVELKEIRHVHRGRNGVWLATAKGAIHVAVNGSIRTELANQDVRQVATGPDGVVLAATGRGLWRRDAMDKWERVRAKDAVSRVWTDGDVRGVAVDAEGTWWVATPAGVCRRQRDQWTFYTGREGLPYADFTCVAVGTGPEVWFGTRRGAIRFDGVDWAYREGPRWLPGNDVRSIGVGADGRVWLATDKGLGCLERRRMTLAEKAAYYEQEIERYIKRTPLGYTSEVGLGAPGDRSRIIYSDSDNDGLWTAMYGAGECFAYGATKAPEFKQRARQAFEALRFLQKVTQGGPHSPPKGFVARTIRPVDWPDPNVGRLEQDREHRQRDRLWKVYEPRWPRSADGKWFWKGDTSSDELDGHFFFYPAYFDLVADSDAERERVREVVRDLTDHLIAHDFCLVDHDGQPTRWAVFGPRQLNDNPDWAVERGLNSLSLLSYLAVAEHVTGDAKYGQVARDLIERHGYGANAMTPKLHLGVGSGNQSDDEMAFMSFYNLLRYTKTEQWREHWRFAFHGYWRLEAPELNPFFNFTFAAVGRGHSGADSFGSFALDPWAGWLEDSLATLRGFPLDRVNWPHQNSHRLDLSPLRRQEAVDLTADDRRPRAGRVNGKVLPVAERHFAHWNTDPWQLDYDGDGRELASGTVFLLPYYMGLYHGFIEKPR